MILLTAKILIFFIHVLKTKKNVLLGLHYGKITSATFPNSNVAINILSPHLPLLGVIDGIRLLKKSNFPPAISKYYGLNTLKLKMLKFHCTGKQTLKQNSYISDHSAQEVFFWRQKLIIQQLRIHQESFYAVRETLKVLWLR